jgi:molybdenum cofactor cytidylyltransferase
MMGPIQFGAVILAGGKSTRFGAPKVLQSFRGTPFLLCITQPLLQAGVENIALVLGHQAEQLISKVPGAENFRIIINQNYEAGQFSSIQAGVRGVPDMLAGVLLCLIDQPHIRSTTYRTVLDKARRMAEKIWIPTYRSKQGHPVFLPGWLLAEIKRQSTGISLRDLLFRFSNGMEKVEVDDPGILEDMDTPEDLQRLEKEIDRAGQKE